jgi:hypothetical protein
MALAALAATTMIIQGGQSALAQAVHGMEQQFSLSDQAAGLIPLIMAAPTPGSGRPRARWPMPGSRSRRIPMSRRSPSRPARGRPDPAEGSHGPR